MNDIIIAYRKRSQAAVDELTQQLSQHYNISGGKPAQWLLGIKIARNKSDQKIWLSQEAYIKKIAKLATKRTAYPIPIGAEKLLSRKFMVASLKIQAYQRKIGSLLFAAVFTRPNIAFATFRLAKFFTNPSYKHQQAANRALVYLLYIRHLFLQFDGANNLIVANNASFADNLFNRKNSQAFAIKLFDGIIS
jgi:hypothetical protein